MKYLDTLVITDRLDFEQRRQSQADLFKIKSKTILVDDKSKPITKDGRYYSRNVGYEKKEVIHNSFTLFSKNAKFSFKDITVIVGENGCGKTTFLNYLKPPVENKFWNFHGEYNTWKDYITHLYISWLKDGHRDLNFVKMPENIFFGDKIHKTSIIKSFSESKTSLSGSEIVSLWDMQTASNGENTLDMLYALRNIQNALIVLDEPETSLSIKSQVRVAKLLKELSENNQLVIVTHSPYIMNIADEVLCLKTKKWVNREKYIKKQENE